MGIFKRQKLNYPITPLDVKSQNDFNEAVMFKLFGNIDYTDLSNAVSSQIQNAYSSSYSYTEHIEGADGGTFTVQLPDGFKGRNFVVSAYYQSMYNSSLLQLPGALKVAYMGITKDIDAGTVTVNYTCQFNLFHYDSTFNTVTAELADPTNNMLDIVIDVIG